jgi:hypothetical protein
MCDRFSPAFGYICPTCFEELVRLGPTMPIEQFMEGEPPNGVDMDTSRQYFDEIFPDCYAPETPLPTHDLAGNPWPRR